MVIIATWKFQNPRLCLGSGRSKFLTYPRISKPTKFIARSVHRFRSSFDSKQLIRIILARVMEHDLRKLRKTVENGVHTCVCIYKNDGISRNFFVPIPHPGKILVVRHLRPSMACTVHVGEDTVSFLDQRRKRGRKWKERSGILIRVSWTKKMRENTTKVKTKDVSRDERFNRFM